MLKRHSQLFEGLFAAADLAVVSVSWVASYWIRFQSDLIPIDKGIPNFLDYAKMLIFVWFIWASVFRRFNLYRPMRGRRKLHEIWLLVKANAFACLILIALTYLFREKSIEFSRLVFLIFWGMSTLMTVLARSMVRKLLRAMRRRGYNRRYALIVGAGPLAEKVARRMLAHRELGVELIGALSRDVVDINDPTPLSTANRGSNGSPLPMKSSNNASSNASSAPFKIVGVYEDLPRFLASGNVDQVIVAMPLCDHDVMEQVVNSVGDSMVDLKIIPDVHQFIQLGSLIEEFEGLPVVSLASTPLIGVNRVLKRIVDIVLSATFLVVFSPLLLLIAVLVKLTSRGPIFYSQERMGLDGRMFYIYKFRSMHIYAERRGARFTTKDDPRTTTLGRILRKTNLDELPQLWNVLWGQMSLVGPRPERPVFIEEFRQHVPRYMLRHKVQAGMTGWAQVHGWRGNTSIERRIEHDLYYIEHWSLVLDLKILFLTLLRGFRDRNAY